MYGPPGCGKSTVAEGLSKKLGYVYVSVGAITRAEIESGSETGKMLKSYLDSLVEYPIDLITGVVRSKLDTLLKGPSKGIIFDGFPKYRSEVVAFRGLCASLSIDIIKIISFDLELEAARNRASKRRICSSCLAQTSVSEASDGRCPLCGGELVVRRDDLPADFDRRYDDHTNSVRATIEALDPLGELRVSVSAGQEPEKVLQCVLNALV